MYLLHMALLKKKGKLCITSKIAILIKQLKLKIYANLVILISLVVSCNSY